MSRSVWFILVAVPMWAQSAGRPDIETQSKRLRELVEHAPKLRLERTRLRIEAPAAGWEIGYPSAVTMDAQGRFLVLQRGEKADPILMVGRDGKIIRSWGKGLYKIPHSIRIDPEGNIWTVDSGSSMVLKFSPQGDKLMEISVGEQPAGRRGASGTTDIAFGPNGRLFIADGYGNSRVLEYTAAGKRVREWGSAGDGPGQFNQPHGIAFDGGSTLFVADRNNARLQRFDLSGKYLGEWDHLGKVNTVTVRDGELWIGTQLRNEANEADGWQMKIDRKSGKILGYTASGHGHHILNVVNHGELLSGARPDTVWWFHKPM